MSENNGRRVARNTLAISIADISGLLIGFIFIAAFARYLGPSQFGIYAFAGAFVGLFHILIDLGLNALSVREVARNKEKLGYYFGNTLAMEFLSSGIVIILISGIAYLMGYNIESITVVFIFSLILGIEAIGWVIFSIFVAFENRMHEALIRVVGKILYLVLGFLGIFLHLDLIQIVGLLLLSSILKIFIGYIVLTQKVVRPHFTINPERWPDILKKALPFALGGFFFDVYFNIDMTMLSYMNGNDAVAYYSVAYKFLNLLFIIPQAFTMSIWPLLSRLHTNSPKSLLYTYEKSLKYLFIISIPISIGSILISDLLINLTFGNQYANSVLPLQILMAVVVFFFISYISGQTLGAINQPQLTVVSLLVCVIVNISLNLYLIPIYSFNGAALATLITEILLVIQYSFYLSRHGITVSLARLSGKPLIAGILMGVCVLFLRPWMSNFSGIIQLSMIIPVACVIYGGVLQALQTFSKEDFTIWREVIKRSP